MKNKIEISDKSYIIHTHLGMGDMFICNGLIRKVVKEDKYEKYYVICKEKNFKTIEAMYSDDDKISVISIKGENEYREVHNLGLSPNNLRVGHEHLNPNIRFDESFYVQLNLTIEDKWKEFKLNRDIDEEERVYNQLVSMPNEEYIFVHDESSLGKVDLKIESKMKIIKPRLGITDNMINFLKVIENAKEIHCVDSSFLSMIDLSVKETSASYFLHDVRKTHSPILSPKWSLIKYE